MTGGNVLRQGLCRYLSVERRQRLRSVAVGFAGAGGLGSNAALMLARSGLERLFLVDFDVVEPSNLNRQQFWPRHVGMAKVDALAELLRELNPDIRVETARERLESGNLDAILPRCPIWVEALDAPETKALFVERALAAGCRVASASGLAGIGGPPMRVRRVGGLTLAGDFASDVSAAPPFAPRVTQAAALLADAVLEEILADAGGIGSFPQPGA